MKALDFLENNLNRNNGKYFAGDKLTGADIILSYPICDNIFSDPERAKVITGGFDVITKYPAMKTWADMIIKEPKLFKAYKIVNSKLNTS